ncbi:helix-turn-helix transcriptional regulator [Geobacillus sp. WSUCF-018B]|uniref:helix-turn-helix domain-containing protein n=1 Tax=Geobacillus sp. WSUCF-018B TaxID=2055939 RepID=UPI000C28F376|nr:helix-turn-helix transcriptional regulator [Geobacillus sp. WSUCF-018B]PJW18906.1 DNA-binding response regulator [Geobacillus sp. WSUCF-018B]
MKDQSFQSKPLLTKREKEVFELLVQDKTTKEIAKELFISEKTVRNHISNVMYFEYINIGKMCYNKGKRRLIVWIWKKNFGN